jgi:NADH:ubiquinone oxidoreductase subunit
MPRFPRHVAQPECHSVDSAWLDAIRGFDEPAVRASHGWVFDMSILSEIFVWWGGTTWGTRLTIWRQGRLVGKDEFGNRYYVQGKGVGPLGVPRRWVIYENLAEPSKVPPDWHGWLHYTVEKPPTAESYAPRPWQKPHVPNMTGTGKAYRPPGSILANADRPKATGDYTPWRPS